jgi:glyoxylase-like metal-dependent hydrolase (beta-lactamase superfamily II)
MKILSLEIPNPFFEGRNRVYLIASEPVTLVDTGVATERAFEKLVENVSQHGYSISDIARVILTHKHIDHIGNAWRIQQESGAEILIHESEMGAVNEVDPGGARFRKLTKKRLTEWGAPEEVIPGDKNSSGPRWEIESATASPLVDGQRLEMGGSSMEVIHTPGHTKGSICLKLGRSLFSGDHVLPDISPNIGGGDMRQRGMLKHFLNSLQRTVDLGSEIDQVFPGHGKPFDHLMQRCKELVEHHQERLQHVVEILEREGPQRVHGLAQFMFGEMRDFHVVLGCAEANAHLEFLIDDGRVAVEQHEYRAV